MTFMEMRKLEEVWKAVKLSCGPTHSGTFRVATQCTMAQSECGSRPWTGWWHDDE
jgi:hypothetical protein